MEKYLKLFLKTVGVFFLFYCNVLLIYIPIFIFKLDVSKISSSTKNLLSIFADIILIIILLFIYRNSIKDDIKKFKNNFTSSMNVATNWWAIGVIGMFACNAFITYVLHGGQAGNEQAVQSLIAKSPLYMIISAGILAPIIEELVFRKNLNIFKNKLIFAIVSGFLFGLAHVLGNVNSWIDWFFILPYGFLGFAFARAYSKTDTICVPITMHMIHNTLLVILSIIR